MNCQDDSCAASVGSKRSESEGEVSSSEKKVVTKSATGNDTEKPLQNNSQSQCEANYNTAQFSINEEELEQTIHLTLILTEKSSPWTFRKGILAHHSVLKLQCTKIIKLI